MSTRNKKAGLVPYIFENGVPIFMFMIPSDPAYGGHRPSIAKGTIDPGENAAQAAVREAEEELGLIASNMMEKTFSLDYVNPAQLGDDATYHFTVYSCQVKNKHNFTKPHFETGSVHWLSAHDFKIYGRKSHVKIVDEINSAILSRLVSN